MNIINQSLTDSNLNILYVGIDNYIELTGIKNSTNYHLVVTGVKATLYNYDKSRYIIRASQYSDTCLVVLMKDRKKILEKAYITELVSAPIATLNGLFNTITDKNKILLNPFLRVVFPGSYFRHRMTVISFNANFIKSGDTTITVTNGYRLSPEQLKITQELNPGDEIYFDQLRATGADTRSIALAPFWIRIQ